MAGLEAALLPQPSDTLPDTDPREFRCVDMPVACQQVPTTWFRRWYKMFSHQSLWMNTVHQEALARLVPTLLCGEQSAVTVFHAETERLSRKARNVSFSIF